MCGDYSEIMGALSMEFVGVVSNYIFRNGHGSLKGVLCRLPSS